MSWAAIIAIVMEILKQRAEAGWPLLKMLLEWFGNRIQKDAESDKQKITVGAAPDEVKDQIIAWLEKQKEKAGPMMKMVYGMVIRFVPLIADQIWDSFFKAGHVSQPLADFTPTTMAAAPVDEKAAFEEAFAA